jgi:two-component system response regulator YesN
MDFVEVISAELFQKRSESKNALIKMAKDFITNNLGNENLNLDMVSRHIGLSSIYFCKLFHKEEGISFNNHLNLVRVSKAKLLLTETSLKVFEVGCETGYGNSKYFNYIFKRIAGMTPLEYRNNGI